MSEKNELLCNEIERVRTEENQKWTKLLEEAKEKQKKDSESQRRQEILEIQKVSMEKLDKILNSHEQRKQEDLFHLREKHQLELRSIKSAKNVEMQELKLKLGEVQAVNICCVPR